MSLKSLAEKAAHALGAVDIVRRRHRANVRILMYHRFHGDLASLSAQCKHLSRNYHSISLTELAESAHQNRPLPPNSLAITVDDGYRDFSRAFPIFQEFGLKVTLYVVSGFAAGELWLWPDQLLFLFENTRRKTVEISLPEGSVQVDLANPAAAFASFSQTLIKIRNQDRLRVLQTLPELLETELPAKVPERFSALSWSELRALAQQGLDIGAHTATHPILSKVDDTEQLKLEIAGSKARIEAASGAAVHHFCYPNGTFSDVSPQAVAQAEQAGFQTAVLAESGFAGPPFDLYQLKRFGVDPEYPAPYFERYVAGYGV